MIIVKLQGGLGNQLFQYGAGRSLATLNNTDLKLDTEWYKTSPNRTYDLGNFNIEAELATPEEIRQLKGGLSSKLKGLLKTEKSSAVLSEQSFRFDPAILKAGPDTYLEGYFQSEKYFQGIAEEIRNNFTVKQEPEGLNATLLTEIQKNQSISLHVRRGDYVSSKKTNSYHGTSSLDYYKAAVDKITSQVENPHFYVFSDDPDWTKEHLIFDYPTTYVTHNGAAAHEDIRLMYSCKHFIIANSTFSWWGAWLSRNPDKTVIAPQAWFATDENDTTDLIPTSWIRL